MKMKVTLNMHSHQIGILLRCFGGASPPASYSDLDTVLEEERLIIPLVTVKDFYLSFPR